MFHHLSAPSRAARQKVSTAEPWKAASPNWEPNTRTRSLSVNNLAVVLEKQGKLEEAGMRSLGWGWPSRQNCQGKACGQDEKLVNFLVSKTGGIWESECESVIL